MRVAAAMIVGPGESLRYLDRTLRLARRWADEVLVYADGVDADTEDAIGEGASSFHREAGPRFPTDESAVRNGLFQLCDNALDPGDLIVVIDADEELRSLDPDHRVKRVLQQLAADLTHDSWPVEFWHLWSPDGSQRRIDGGWAPAPQQRIYRHVPGLRMAPRALACGAIPPIGPLRASPDRARLAMAHWGYARPHDRAAKHERYMRLDGGRYHALWHLESIIQEPTLEPIP